MTDFVRTQRNLKPAAGGKISDPLATYLGNVRMQPGKHAWGALSARGMITALMRAMETKILRGEIYMPILLKNQKFVAGRKFCEKIAGSE